MTDNTETRTSSSTGGEKGVKLARFELLPAGPLAEVASRFGLGAMKYDHRNWERGYEWGKSFGALMRHAQAFWDGEDDDDLGEEAFRAAGLDPEDFKVDGRIPGSAHLAGVAFHALALMEWSATHPEFDDRVNSSKRAQKKAAKRRRKELAKARAVLTESQINHLALQKASKMRRQERIAAAAQELDAELTKDARALRDMELHASGNVSDDFIAIATGESVETLMKNQSELDRELAEQLVNHGIPTRYVTGQLPGPLPEGFLEPFGYERRRLTEQETVFEEGFKPIQDQINSAKRRQAEIAAWNSGPKPWLDPIDRGE